MIVTGMIYDIISLFLWWSRPANPKTCLTNIIRTF